MGRKMNSFGSQQQQGLYFGAYYGEEVRRAGHERRGMVVCPKPRRAGRLPGPEPVRPHRLNVCEQVEPSDWNASAEIFDIFSRKQGAEPNQIISSPPYFCGSPPSRASNPLVRDKLFGQEDPVAQNLVSVPTLMSSKVASPMNTPVSTSSCKGCAPAKFGFQPATMRIEGFDCLNSDRRGCGITAIA